MNKKNTRILLVEDDASLAEIAVYQLETAGYSVDHFSSGELAWENFEQKEADLVLTDLVLEGSLNGDILLKKVKSRNPEVPVILMTANGTIDSAVDCVRSGAWHYLTKPFHWDDMLGQIQNALSFCLMKSENVRLKKLVGSYEGFENIVGDSSAMIEVKKQMHRLLGSDAPVLIQGESGTGKEMVARSLHLNSTRKGQPFIAVNCGAIVKELAESELFGHVKGAFTGAEKDKKGYFMDADGGTIFLDEISELPMNLQVKFLRVLQESEVTPVGQSKPNMVNVRVVAACNVDLNEAVRVGDFREDLFYRISVLPLSLPSLRDRLEDIEKLSHLFLEKSGKDRSFSAEFLKRLKTYDWPGNIRELENFMTRLSVLYPETEVLDLAHIPIDSLEVKSMQPVPFQIPDEGIDLDLHVRKLIESALGKCNGNQTKAAKLLKITRSTLIYRMQKFGL